MLCKGHLKNDQFAAKTRQTYKIEQSRNIASKQIFFEAAKFQANMTQIEKSSKISSKNIFIETAKFRTGHNFFILKATAEIFKLRKVHNKHKIKAPRDHKPYLLN